MKKSQADPTTAKNLEGKFERDEDVLDYFDVREARVINPQSKGSVAVLFRHSSFATPLTSDF